MLQDASSGAQIHLRADGQGLFQPYEIAIWAAWPIVTRDDGVDHSQRHFGLCIMIVTNVVAIRPTGTG
jgi:hypothetical protein